MEKDQRTLSFFDTLSFLMLKDTRGRWAGILLVILAGSIAGSAELIGGDSSIKDAEFDMSIVMGLTALIFFGVYTFTRSRTAALQNPPDFKKTLRVGTTILSVAVVFSCSSVWYQEIVLNRVFAQAVSTNDIGSMAETAVRAENVSARLHKELVTKSESVIVTATRNPSSWNGVLLSLRTVTYTINRVPQFAVKKSAGSTPIAWGSAIVGSGYDISDLDVDGFVDAGHGIYDSPPLLENVLIKGGQQTLDGFEWRGDVFVETHIKYKGGPVKLEKTRFVNCTFELPRDENGAKLAQYVALKLPVLTVGSAPYWTK